MKEWFGKRSAILRVALSLGLITVCAALFVLLGQSADSQTWQYDSEGLVIGRMYQMQTGQNAKNPAGFLGAFDTPDSENDGAACAYDQFGLYVDDVPVTSRQYWVYTHQSGAQGMLYGAANRALCLLELPARARLSVLHFINAWLLCAAVFAICLWAKREWGVVPAVFCGAGLLLSPWTLRAGTNLYWQLWLYLGLFALAAWVARMCAQKKTLSGLGLLALFAALLFRFLCGFEFVSSVLVCVEVPFVYYFAKQCRGGVRACLQWLRAALGVALAGLSAFAAAMLIWFWQLYLHFDSAGRAISEMLAPIANRTGALGAAQAEYGASLAMPFGEVLRLYMMDDTVLFGVSVLGLLILYGVLLAGAVFATVKKGEKDTIQTHTALLAAVLTGAAAAVSWLVLARGHAAVHPHINYILWLLPFVPLCCAHIGMCAQTIYAYVRAELEARKGKAT